MSHGYLKSMRCRSKIAARQPPGGPTRVLLTVMDARVSAQMPTGVIVRAAKAGAQPLYQDRGAERTPAALQPPVLSRWRI